MRERLPEDFEAAGVALPYGRSKRTDENTVSYKLARFSGAFLGATRSPFFPRNFSSRALAGCRSRFRPVPLRLDNAAVYFPAASPFACSARSAYTGDFTFDLYADGHIARL